MIYGAGRYVKHYVSVLALHRPDGMISPVTIIWDDGRRFDVDLLKEAHHKRCEKTAGHALAFSVSIYGKRRTLYHDNQGWFVEILEGGTPRRRTDPRLSEIPK
ncbi:hypothetical protein [Eggerthella sp. YY7918]|uniref:hypothetical protein n=1 Tax=Eggerthella sp. (strain YY7918) TaxID=502558 RepID=UPI000217129C|nr:hypothetical protein [Eggerthella sp. YY7918]BAK45832.1 hypothetical protein EGYY_28550 [Eggerthella sp. YY7918]